MNKRQLETVFNKQITEFIMQVKNSFPELMKEKQISALDDTWETTVSLTPSIPIQMFYKHLIEPYDKQILQKNSDFFLGLDCSTEPLNIFKYVYIGASPSNREIIWTYIHRLRILCLRYFNLQNNKNNIDKSE